MPDDGFFIEDEAFQPELPVVRMVREEAGSYVSDVTHHLRGEVLRTVFASQDSDYAVIRLEDSTGAVRTLVGGLKSLLEGQNIEATGRWENHKEHGRQFRVESFQAVLPNTIEGIKKYLASGLIEGIGETYASRIVDCFGLETLSILDNHSERLREVPGIGKKRLEEIRLAWREQNLQRDTDIFLRGIGLSSVFCTKVKEAYGAENAAEIVRRNPYRLANDIDGIGFLGADRIASNLGVAINSPQRLSAGILYTLDEFSQSGHVYATKEQVFEAASVRLNVSEEDLENGLHEAVMQGRVIREVSRSSEHEERFFTRRLYQSEVSLADSIRAMLARGGCPWAVSRDCISDEFGRLNERQRAGVRCAFSEPFSIITGGPGVGKTTVVGQIVAIAKRLHKRMLLAAPTGRASRRMTEATGENAQTIHRLLQWDGQNREFLHNADSPLECDLLIIDEVSMLDTSLAASLFQAVPPEGHVVLVGDRNQLPSVGPGAVLHDLIACGRIPVTELTEIYRQASGSRIVTNAHAVNQGRMPDCRPLPSGTLGDFYWVEQEDTSRAADVMVRTIVERIPKVFGFDPMADVQVLSPMKKGDCGTQAMNLRLQAALNPPSPQKEEFKTGWGFFRTGDRVMQIKNNYDKGVFNGEMGRVLFIDNAGGRFTVQFDSTTAEYDATSVSELVLAYAVTVHKSQGSEYPVVLMPIHSQHYIMLQRNLVYTGMTRAKKLLILVGGYRALAQAVRNDKPMMRQTALVERLTRLEP